MNQRVKTFTIGFDGDAAYDETAGRARGRRALQHRSHGIQGQAVGHRSRRPAGVAPRWPVRRFIRHSDLSRVPAHARTGDGRPDRRRRRRAVCRLSPFRRGAGGRALAAGGRRGRCRRRSVRCRAARNERHLLARARRFARFMHLPAARARGALEQPVPGRRAGAAAARRRSRATSSSIRCATSERIREAIGGFSPLGRLLAANFASYLPDDLLVKTDRCTMANALEARAPLLDTALTEYAASLPDDYKLRGRTTKAVLRDAFARSPAAATSPTARRPGSVCRSMPGSATELRDFVRDTLLAPSAALGRYVRTDRVRTADRRSPRRPHQRGATAVVARVLRAVAEAAARLERAGGDRAMSRALPAAGLLGTMPRALSMISTIGVPLRRGVRAVAGRRSRSAGLPRRVWGSSPVRARIAGTAAPSRSSAAWASPSSCSSAPRSSALRASAAGARRHRRR